MPYDDALFPSIKRRGAGFFMFNRRDNRLTTDEVHTAITPLEHDILTFDEAFKLFIADGERRGLRPDTISYYRQNVGMFRRYLVQVDKTDLISKVVRQDIDGFVEHEKARGMSNNTINIRLRGVRALFSYLHDMKYIAVHPMVKYPLLKIRNANINAFSMKQLRQLLSAPDRRTFTGLRDYTLMLLLVETGLRLSEVTAVQVDDVKLSEGLVFVRHTKGHMHRHVPIQAKMKEQLRRYIKIRGTCETENLFVTLGGASMARETIQKIVGKYGKQAGITGVRCSPHTLRHTFAKMSVMNGAGVFELQKILGHSTMEMVKVYVNLYSGEINERHKEFSPLNNL